MIGLAIVHLPLPWVRFPLHGQKLITARPDKMEHNSVSIRQPVKRAEGKAHTGAARFSVSIHSWKKLALTINRQILYVSVFRI